MGFVIDNIIYIGCGTNDVGTEYNQFWGYNTSNDTWAEKATFPGYSRALGCAFAIGDTGYAGFGEDSLEQYFNDFYRFKPDSTLGLQLVFADNQIEAYPNPFSTYCHIFLPQNEDDEQVQITIYNIQGKEVKAKISELDNEYVINRSGLQTGVYILSIGLTNQTIYKKLLITN